MTRPACLVARLAPAFLLLVLACVFALPGRAAAEQTLQQAISDRAQSTTIAFSGLAVITGNLEAQSFFPPGKLADYWGFQELRDNDPSGMGHNTSFLTRVACNVLYDLDGVQIAQLRALATAQTAQIDDYGYGRYPLMQAFRRLLEGDLPAGATGLDETAVAQASSDLCVLDGRISFARAVVYADVFRSLTPAQKAYLDAMVGKGWADWPDKDMDDVRDKMAGLSHDESVAVMTYAGDLFSWYAGNVDKDVYFCPERHGTYYGGFYMKDAPAVGREGYSIDPQLTATAGSALCDPAQGYVTAPQAAYIDDLLDVQRDNLYAGTQNIVQARRDIATALRSLIGPAAPLQATLDAVEQTVLATSAVYGRLDGEDNYHYATAFAQLEASLTTDQRTRLLDLRRSILSGTYGDGTPFDFTVCAAPYLFSAVIADRSVLAPYLAGSTRLFATTAPVLGITAPTAASSWPCNTGQTVSWTLNAPVPGGEFRVWLVSATGGWYVGRQILPLAGRTTYSTAIAVSCPAGAGYRACVYWRPTVGSGGWVSTAKSAALTVTALGITSPAASSSWAVGSSQTVSWTVSPAVAAGEFKVWLVGAAGGWYVGKVVPAVTGRTSYVAGITVSVPSPGAYKAYVYYRPTAGSGGWTMTLRSASFAAVQ